MDEAELAKLYTRYGYTLFRRCAVYLGAQAAQAAVQHVFVQAVRAGGVPPEGSDPRTWLCRLADQLCSERFASAAGALALAPGVQQLAAADLEASGFQPAGTAASVAPVLLQSSEQDAIAREVTDDDRDALLIVQRLLARLPPGERRLAVLYYLDELTEEELARELGWSRRTVRRGVQNLLDQARVLLREREAS